MISRLSDPDCGIEEEPFRNIMRYKLAITAFSSDIFRGIAGHDNEKVSDIRSTNILNHTLHFIFTTQVFAVLYSERSSI